MDFNEALQIARQHPGAIVTPGESGFVVRGADGTVFGHSAPTNDPDTLRRENEWLRERYEQVQAQREEAARAHRAEIVGLEARITEIYGRLHELRTEREHLASAFKQLQERATKVSAAEWERIAAEEKADLAKRAKDMKAARHVQSCPCRGEVENCVRCSGKGTYVTDGFGNIVNE